MSTRLYYVYTPKDATREQLDVLRSMSAKSIVQEPIAQKIFGLHDPNEADYIICPVYFNKHEPTNALYKRVVDSCGQTWKNLEQVRNYFSKRK